MLFFKPGIKYESLDKSIIKKYNASRGDFIKKYICNAPFTALRFDLNGRMLVCCYNQVHVLGYYPTDSILAVWNGEKAEKLRRHVAKNDLSLGCNICCNHLKNNSFFTVKSRLYDHLKPLKKQPVLLEFELDNTCNLECIMCNGEVSSMIRKKEAHPPTFTTKYDKNFLEQLKPFLSKIQLANFIGGEPLLIPMYFDIMEEIIRVNLKAKINISTNGTILNDRIKKLLENGNFDIAISIDSIEKETYELIRKNADFEKTFSNLQYFHDYCKHNGRHISIWVCPLVINRFEIPAIFEFFNKMNIPVYLNEVHNPRYLSISSLEENDLLELKNHYKSFVFTNNSSITYENANRFYEFVKQVDIWIQLSRNNKILFQNKNEEQIMSIILTKLEDYYKIKYAESPEKFRNTINEANVKFIKILSHFNDENMLKNVLFYILNFSTGEIALALETKDVGDILEHILIEFEKNKFN
jgi:molybdenum cofactor biosynthesis enzyme MoaA